MMALQTLCNTWAYVGNFLHPSAENPSVKITFMPYDKALIYADDVFQWTLDSGVPPSQQLRWMMDNNWEESNGTSKGFTKRTRIGIYKATG